MKQFIKSTLFTLFKTLEVDKRYIKDIKTNHHLTILSLHQVSPKANPYYPPLHPELFEILLAYISQHFNVITFAQIEEYKESHKPNLILSFDDGYYDFYEYVMPLLEKYSLRANLNIIPECVESAMPMWNIRLYDFLNSSSLEQINIIDLQGFEEKLRSDSVADKSKYGLAISRFLKNRPRAERDKLFKELFDDIEKNHTIEYTKMLGREEIISIAKIHEIGVHSYAHESMKFESSDYFENDFRLCQEYFRDKLQLPLDIYAFPNGSYRDEQIDFLLEQGIGHILLVDDKYADYDSPTKKRFTFYADSANEVKLRAVGFFK